VNYPVPMDVLQLYYRTPSVMCLVITLIATLIMDIVILKGIVTQRNMSQETSA